MIHRIPAVADMWSTLRRCLARISTVKLGTLNRVVIDQELSKNEGGSYEDEK